MLDLERKNVTLKQQLQHATTGAKGTILNLENKIKDLTVNNIELKNTIQVLEEKFGKDKISWQQKCEMVEKEKTEEVSKLQEMCKAYKLDIKDLQTQLELEEQTVQVSVIDPSR